MLHYVIYTILITSAMSIPSPGPLTREVGQDVVFMFNASDNIDAFKWGTRVGNTNDLKQGFINYNKQDGMQQDKKINSTSYAGRVSFVGDLSKGQAWFKITNLNINDTKWYMAWILILKKASAYTYVPAQLTVIIPTTSPPTTFMTTLKSASLSTQDLTTLPIATSKPITLTNLTTDLKVEGKFSEEMKNKASFDFQTFSNKFEIAVSHYLSTGIEIDCTIIQYAYSRQSNFKSADVISLSEGSIHVTFVVFFKNEIKYEEACAPLEKAIENGTLESFKIVPGSLGCSKPKSSSPRPPGRPGARTGVHPGIIAGVAVAGVLAIAAFIITIIYVCRKKASKKDYRSSTRPSQGHEMETRYGEPEEHYASIQRQNAQGSIQSHENDQPLPQYAVVDKTKKTKKKPPEPGELVYAQLDHEFNASMGARPPSDRRPIGESNTVYADIRDKQQQRPPPPQYGNIDDMSYA